MMYSISVGMHVSRPLLTEVLRPRLMYTTEVCADSNVSNAAWLRICQRDHLHGHLVAHHGRISCHLMVLVVPVVSPDT